MSNTDFPFDDRFEFLNEDLKRIDASQQDWSRVEELILAAGNYVVPGDQLRPRTIEAARDICDDKRRTRRNVKLAAAMFMAVVIWIPMSNQFSSWRDNRLVTDASEVEQRAQQISRSTRVGGHWGLYEAFSELRSQQAQRLGRVVQ